MPELFDLKPDAHQNAMRLDYASGISKRGLHALWDEIMKSREGLRGFRADMAIDGSVRLTLPSASFEGNFGMISCWVYVNIDNSIVRLTFQYSVWLNEQARFFAPMELPCMDFFEHDWTCVPSEKDVIEVAKKVALRMNHDAAKMIEALACDAILAASMS